jgi:AraC-like DNA-binding protein
MLTSRNYAPAADLAPYIRRHYVFEADMPANFVVEDQILSETAFVRVILNGDWQGRLETGEIGRAGPALLFGGNYTPFPAKVTGAFRMAGFAVKPSAWRALFSESAPDLVDRMLPLEQVWPGIAETMLSEMQSATTDEGIVAAMEKAIRAQIQHIGRPGVDHKVAIFEEIARTESTLKVEIAALRMGLSIGQTERRVRACYGLTPKAVLRRSRFLELATAMRGLYAPDEQHLAVLRYFDQSHVNRECRHFTGRNPSVFKKDFTPLFDVGLKLRLEGLTLP